MIQPSQPGKGTRAIGAPTLRGWLSGRPDRESNAAVDLARKLGLRTEPGLYEAIAQQWYRLAKWLRTGRAELGSLPWETRPCGSTPDRPEGDETFDERLWNSQLAELLAGSRVSVETAVPGQYRRGWSEWVGLVHDAYWHGFTLAAPYWHGGASMVDGEIRMEVMLRSAVDRFELGPDNAPEQVWYSTATGYQRVDYDRLIHVVPQGVTGQLFGEAALRPMVGPGLAWIQSLVQSGAAEVAEAGMLVLHGRTGADDEDADRYDAILRANDDGQLRGALLYGEEQLRREFPGSSSSGRSDRMRHLDEICDAYFSRQNASLYASGSGSRAASETVGDEDSEVREVTADALVDLAYQSLAAWVARETGYTGRIREARTVQPEARQSPVELVGALSTARGAGLLDWTAEDQAQLREALGWSPLPETDAQESDTPALTVGALTASVEIARAMGGSEGQAPLNPAVARELLRGAGLPADAVERIVEAATEEASAPPAPSTLPDDDTPSLDDLLSLDSIALADPHPAGCGCGSHRAQLGEEREVIGRDGRAIRVRMATGPVDIDGALHYVDESVAWLAEVEADTAVLDGLSSLLWPQAEEHRAEVASAVRRGASASDLEQIQRRWAARYAGVIRSAIARERARQAAEASAVAEAQTARAPDRVYVLQPTPADRAVRALLEAAVRDARQAATTIASRVQGEAVRQGTSGLPSRITPAGLAREATGPVRAAGQAQAVESAGQAAPPGFGVIGWIRLGYLDGRICEWCEGQHRKRWVMRTQREEFAEYVEQHGPPDPECAGTAERCRCRLVPVYGRVDVGEQAG